MPGQEALAEAFGQEASAEPSASAAGLPKPIPDSTVWPPETIEEALAEVLEQEAVADPSASAVCLDLVALPESDFAAFPLPDKPARRPSLEDLAARQLVAETLTKKNTRGAGCLALTKGRQGALDAWPWQASQG